MLGLVTGPRAEAVCSAPSAALVGWWPGDGNAKDLAGTNHGVLQGGSQAGTAGIVGSAFSFDGTNGYVQIPDSPVLRPTNLTIEAWVLFSSLDSAGSGGSPAGEQFIVFKQNTRAYNFEGFSVSKLRRAGGDVLAFVVSSALGEAVELLSATRLSTGVWYHVAGVRGANFAQLYVNGQLERQTNVSFPQDYGSYPLFFGSSGQAHWDGKLCGSLDEVSLYRRALSSNEVAAVYTAGAAGKCKPTPPSTSTPDSQGADAVVLVNSSSARYVDFQRYLQPYLDNFGVPYTVLDLATHGIATNLDRCALIVIGHSQLDTNKMFLTSAAEASLLLAVSNGTGLVSFDGALATEGGAARYDFVQSIFGFGYGGSGVGTTVTLPATEPLSQMHYITARHPAGDPLTFRSGISLPSVTVPSNVTVLALSGAQPLLAVARYGKGRAAQWTSSDWMSASVLGPVCGLDDLVWRSLVWAARKPFVMRGLPNFVTLRMDDAGGPFWWVHIAHEMGFKPWLGLFIDYVTEASAADLRSLVTNGKATASIHSFDCCGDFFYYNHSAAAPWPDNVISNHFYLGTLWHAARGIPISKAVVAHYSEIGPNAFAGLKEWGVEFVNINFPPGYQWFSNPPWLKAGPYRLYDTSGSPTISRHVIVFADFFSVPSHPEFDGQFFSGVTEILDDAACGEWCPVNDDVAGSIARGTRQLKRAFDSMVMGALYSHEWYLIPIPQSRNQIPMTPENWRAILQGITNNLAAYNPSYVTYDHACQYLRATRTSRLTASDYDPVSGRVTVSLSGRAEVDLQVSVYVGEDNSISSRTFTVPAFSGSAAPPAAVPLTPRLSINSTPTNAVMLSWLNLGPGFVLQQKPGSGAGSWTLVTNPPVMAGGQLQVVIPKPATNQFYRLALP